MPRLSGFGKMKLQMMALTVGNSGVFELVLKTRYEKRIMFHVFQ